MKNVVFKQAGGTPALESVFRKVEPASEGHRLLPARELRDYLGLSYSDFGAGEAYRRYLSAKDRLRERFGAFVDVAQSPHGLKAVARLQLHTSDRTMDEELYSFVKGMGFELTLKTDGSGKGLYCVSEGYATDPLKIAVIAEDLLRLASMLAPAERLPDNVVDISAARSAMARPERPLSPRKAASGAGGSGF
jgi:hypothetical protein